VAFDTEANLSGFVELLPIGTAVFLPKSIIGGLMIFLSRQFQMFLACFGALFFSEVQEKPNRGLESRTCLAMLARTLRRAFHSTRRAMGVTKTVITEGDGKTFPTAGDKLSMRKAACVT
jgi:hypothetical protein